MRPSLLFAIVIFLVVAVQLTLIGVAGHRLVLAARFENQMRAAVAAFGLSDLCIATDARYIRNPAVSDRLAPYMDHPGNIEHFPTGSFWAPEPPAHH